jgi:DNA-binding CsgD family transcriptional regulator
MLDTSFRRRVDELRDCDSVSDFVVGLRSFARALGFSSVQLKAIRRVAQISRLKLVEAVADRARYDRAIEIGDLDDVGLPPNDPVVARLRDFPLPVIWGRDTYLSAGLSDFYESSMVPASLSNGIGLRSTLPSAPDVDVLLMMQRKEEVRPHHEMELAAAVSLLACYCNHFADQVLWSEYLKKSGDTSPLTPSQAECIYWAAQGLSVKETARALGKSPATVGNTIQAAMRRMDCTRKEQAVRLCMENKWLPTHLRGRQRG